jgi:hypothetical protein
MLPRRHLLALLAASPLALVARAARAQQRPIEVKVGEDVFFQLPRQPQILGTEHPDIATVTVLPDGRARIHGVSVGATRIIGRDFGDLPMIFPIVVNAR